MHAITCSSRTFRNWTTTVCGLWSGRAGPFGTPKPLFIGGTEISGGTRIDITEESAAFELIWKRYVAYAVMNESYASVDDEAQYTGNRFRVYSKSHFIDYASRASFACEEYPGPTRHIAIICENHVIDVIAAVTPVIQRLC